MKYGKPIIIAAVIAAGVTMAMSAALDDQAVAFATGVAVFIAFGGFGARRSGE